MKKSKDANPNINLKQAREKRGWTQQEVADQIGTTPGTYSRWERGTSFPSSKSRMDLCALFGKSEQELGLDEKSYKIYKASLSTGRITTHLTPFIGREKEIMQVCNLL